MEDYILTHHIVGAVISLLVLYIMFGTEIKSKSTPKVLFNIPHIVNNSKITLCGCHIHHWFIFSIVFIFLFTNDNPLINVMRGFSFVMIAHGLLYDDRFEI